MTRTRTQSALTKLVTMVANVHGELEFVEGLLLAGQYAGPHGKAVFFQPAQRAGLEARQVALLGQREALYATVRQFDPGLVPEEIGSLADWCRPLGRGKPAIARYAEAISRVLTWPGSPLQLRRC